MHIPEIPVTLKRVLIPLVTVFIFTKLPIEEEQKGQLVRIIFAVKSVFLGIFLVALHRIMPKNPPRPTDKVRVEETSFEDGKSALVCETISAAEYDKREYDRMMKHQFIQSGIILFLHYYMQTNLPVMVTTVMWIMQTYESPLFRIYLLGLTSADEEELRRPFKNSADTTAFYKRFMGLKSEKDLKNSARSQKKEAKAKERQEKRKLK